MKGLLHLGSYSLVDAAPLPKPNRGHAVENSASSHRMKKFCKDHCYSHFQVISLEHPTTILKESLERNENLFLVSSLTAQVHIGTTYPSFML